MRATVGRAVHYVSHGSPDGRYRSECRAATVTAVGEGFVSLCVMNPTGLFFNEVVPECVDHEGGTWHWPEREPVAVTVTDAMVEAFGEAWQNTPAGAEGDRRRAGLKAALEVQ